jgi:hypothetical protein
MTFHPNSSKGSSSVYYSKISTTAGRTPFYRIERLVQGIWYWCEVYNDSLGRYVRFAHARMLANAKRFCNMHANDEPLPYQATN